MSAAADPAVWAPPGLPAAPAWQLDWPALLDRLPMLRALAGCPQDPVYHAEGDVLVHTRLVVEALVASAEWRALPQAARAILFAAALLHDAGKPARTAIEPDGRVVSPGHALAGARLARALLYWATGGCRPRRCPTARPSSASSATTRCRSTPSPSAIPTPPRSARAFAPGSTTWRSWPRPTSAGVSVRIGASCWSGSRSSANWRGR